MSGEAIEGVKLISHRASGVDGPDDETMPYRLVAVLEAPDFMRMAFVLLYGGTEDIVVRGRTSSALEELVAVNRLAGHPRLIRMAIYGPGGKISVAWRRGMVLRDDAAEKAAT